MRLAHYFTRKKIPRLCLNEAEKHVRSQFPLCSHDATEPLEFLQKGIAQVPERAIEFIARMTLADAFLVYLRVPFLEFFFKHDDRVEIKDVFTFMRRGQEVDDLIGEIGREQVELQSYDFCD